MSKKCRWAVGFKDGDRVYVDAASKRMAKAKGSVEAHQLPEEITLAHKQGNTRNGNRPLRSRRSSRRRERRALRSNPAATAQTPTWF